MQPPPSLREGLVSVLALIAVGVLLAAVVWAGAAQLNAAAIDGQTLADQPAEVQRIYRSLYGEGAASIWEADHNREIGQSDAERCATAFGDGRTVAHDGRHLRQEPPDVQALFDRVHGVHAEARWVCEYERLHPPPASSPEVGSDGDDGGDGQRDDGPDRPTAPPRAAPRSTPPPPRQASRQPPPRPPPPTQPPVPITGWHEHPGLSTHRHTVETYACLVNGRHEHTRPPCPTPTPRSTPTTLGPCWDIANLNDKDLDCAVRTTR